MNCLDFHRQALSDPHHLSAEAQAHRAGCVACRNFCQKVLECDSLATDELRTSVREGLEQRLVLAYRLRARRRLIGLVMAASLLLVTAVAGLLVWRDTNRPDEPAWIALMGERLEWDPLHLKAPADDAPQRLVEAIAELGGRMDTPPLNVVQARICKLNGHWVAHLVMEINGERVVAFVLPESLPEDLSRFGQWQARLSSHDGGSIGVFAQNLQTAEQALHELEGRIRWT